MENINVISNNMSVQFRSKFSQHLTGLSESLVKKILDITKDFCSNKYEDERAATFLWEMTYSPETALERIGLKFKHVNSDNPETVESTENGESQDTASPLIVEYTEDIVASSNNEPTISAFLAGKFRDELRYQRKLTHKNFLKVESIPESCSEAYTALVNAAVQDKIVAYAVYNICKEAAIKIDSETSERILFLLGSTKESNNFGGLRSLGIGYSAAAYLKPYVKQIHDLFDVLVGEHASGSQEEESFGNMPFANLKDMLGTDQLAGCKSQYKIDKKIQNRIDKKIQYALFHKMVIVFYHFMEYYIFYFLLSTSSNLSFKR